MATSTSRKGKKPTRSKDNGDGDITLLSDADLKEWGDIIGTGGSDPGYTVTELAEKFGVCTRTARKRVLSAVEEGRCVAGMATRVNASGVSRQVEVYDLK